MKPKKSTSPKKAAEPTVDLLGLDGPAQAPVTNGSAVVGPALNDDLDIFGQMISNPLPATVMPPAQGTSSAPAAATLSAVTSGDLDLFTEQAAKSEEVAKKQLSKDSILSLYGAGAIQQQGAPGNSSETCLQCRRCGFRMSMMFLPCLSCVMSASVVAVCTTTKLT